MKFSELVDQAAELLQRRGRVTYRALKREFALDDETLEDVTAELIDALRVVADEAGKVLVWTGEARTGEPENRGIGEQKASPQSLTPKPQPPVSYTPAHLAERIRAEQAAMAARGSANGERKTITALFADLKGSTALIEGLDPEEARAIIDPALQLMMDAVHRYEGYVAQALGDGIFALFGAPLAHEDHPQRAVYAALRMQEEMRRYADTLRHKGYPPLLMRVGLNTGEVVVRSIRKDDLHIDYVPVGHSTNLAARMEQLAAPGSILVSAYTHKLTEGYFAFKDLGETQIKGMEAPLPLYEVLGAGLLRTRFQVTARRGLTRFIGRQRELDQLQSALEQTKAGQGQLVGVMGEPGLGKSRLFHEFVGAYGRAPLLVLQAYAVSYGRTSPYLPLIELLKDYFQIEPTDDERTRRQKVIGQVLELDRSLEDTLPYLFALLGIEEQPSSLQQMDAQIRRKRTFEALKRLFLRESLNQPLILIFEDLHWIDSETQGFLDTLSDGIASAQILLLVNYRPEYRHEWGQKTYYTQLRLAPFGKAEAEEFLDVLLGNTVGAGLVPAHSVTEHPYKDAPSHKGTPLQQLKQLILAKTDGSPFFMEEIVQELVEQGVLAHAGRPQESPLQIPTTVQAVLAARIDRLAPDEKSLLQQLAVIGRQFPLSLAKEVVQRPEDKLYRLLGSLQTKEFLYEQPAFPESEYIFKHALTQEVAYGTVLHEQRKILHERTGQTMEMLYQNNLDEHYSELAYHYSRTANIQKAVAYLQLVGQQSLQRSANTEAAQYLTAAITCAQTLPDGPERLRRELDLQATLGPVLLQTKGYGDPEAERVYERALEICEQVEDTAHLFPLLWGSSAFYCARSQVRTAIQNMERCLVLALRAQDTALLIEAYYGLGSNLYYAGDFCRAREYLEQAITLYDPHQHHALSFEYAVDPGVASRAFLAHVLWMLGYPDQARRRVQEAIVLAQELGHLHSQSGALGWGAGLPHLLRDAPGVQEQARVVIHLSEEHGLPFPLGRATVQHGWALAAQGRPELGLQQIREGARTFRVAAGAIDRQEMLVLCVEAYHVVGRSTEGVAVLAEAIAGLKEEGEHCFEAELYRLKGELTLGAGGWRLETSPPSVQAPSLDPQVPSRVAQEAEEYFLKAIDVAQKQQAKSWELRAATSLARLWQSQGKTTEAHALLAPVYNWFTEGFDTADLKYAKVLLEELA